MTTIVRDQNRAYRKGLLLGFTMAELSILIIFALLLTTSFITKKKNNEIQKNITELTELRELKKNIEQHILNGNQYHDISDVFQEIKKMEELRNALDNLEQLRQENKKNHKKIARFKKANQIIETIKGTPFETASPEKIKELIQNSLQTEKISAENKLLKGQVINIQNKLRSLGRGTEMPSCWANTKTGQPEYIFKIFMSERGILITNISPPNHQADFSRLPIQRIHFNQPLSNQAFIEDTLPIFKWSVEHNCRFFSIVVDETASNEKLAYKTMLHNVEKHFYKYESPK